MSRSERGLTIHGGISLFLAVAMVGIVGHAVTVAREAEATAHASRGKLRELLDRFESARSSLEERVGRSQTAAEARSAEANAPLRQSVGEPEKGTGEGNDERALVLLEQLATLETRAAQLTWPRWWKESRARLGTIGDLSPKPTDPTELGKAIWFDVLTTLAQQDPMSRSYPRALDVLRTEILVNADRLPLRLRALSSLRRLGPQSRRGPDVLLVLTGENEDALGRELIGRELLPNLAAISREHPTLRSSLFNALEGIRAPEVRDLAIDGLADPRRSIREMALKLLLSQPRDEARDAALRRALDATDPGLSIEDARLRRAIEEAL